ncbi:MAG: hypothetical protein M4579_001885 [Chaenotheca gracillima]|nr:MAG: hypothetical protein M4579_001885 [Chaenotheca gracillima]
MSSLSEESDEGGEDAGPAGIVAERSLQAENQSLEAEERGAQRRPNGLNHDQTQVEAEDAGYDETGDDPESQHLANESSGHRRMVLRGDKGSPDGSLLSPDDTPSLQDSLPSSPSSSAFARGVSNSRLSPTPSLQPFDRRFKARLSSPLNSPRALSPAFLATHSRQSSVSSQLLRDAGDDEPSSAPWEAVRWTKLKKITAQAFSEAGRRNFGKPTCLSAAANITIGTSKGVILIFDYHQNLKSIIGLGTKATEAGAITSLTTSADHTTVAGGHSDGTIFTWDLAKSAKPFLQISPLSKSDLDNRKSDGHVSGTPVLHLGFLGTRHTALASADSRGMAFSHLATRGLGAVGRSVKTTRVLGRYPDSNATSTKSRKPSTVMAFSPLPLGNAEQSTDTIGLVAMLTPYLLVIVSTTPIPQTQHKSARPKELTAHGALSGCLAWFPAVKLKTKPENSSETTSKPKLAYCWSNVLTILDVHDVEPSEPGDKDQPPNLAFRPRSRWRAEESIVAVQWLGRSILAVLTITQQLVILEDSSMRVTEKFDLLQKHIYHQDVFSKQLQNLVEPLDEEDPTMHGVVSDAFYASFRAYKGRMFVLGFNDVQVGTLSNWADRLVALMEEGNFIGAIELATSYYNGDADRLTVGLPDDGPLRHSLVEEKLLEMISASLRYALGPNNKVEAEQTRQTQLTELASACFIACVSMENLDFLFEDVYEPFAEGSAGGIFFEKLEPYILDSQVRSVPPAVLKDLISYFTSKGFESTLEEMICHLDVTTMDLDQITTLCKENNLYDALIYVWNQAIHDYTTPLIDLLSLVKPTQGSSHPSNRHQEEQSADLVSALKLFPYLSYTLTGRIYPTGEDMSEHEASRAKAEIYFFIFSGKTITWPKEGGEPFLTRPAAREPPFPYLRLILELDGPSFLSVLNEAFEDSFLNGSTDRMVNNEAKDSLSDEQMFGLSINRQYIVNILLETLNSDNFSSEDTIYLDMFIARNLPKFPQFILLSGTSLHRILVGLCNFPSDDIADDCQLSVEYLLSFYHPSDIESLIPLFTKAHFYRVLKSIYRADKQYASLLQTCFDDEANQEAVFDCIEDCLRPRTGLTPKQRGEVRLVIEKHAQKLATIDIRRTAKTINSYASDLHSTVLAAIEPDHHMQYDYLRTFMEPDRDKSEPHVPQSSGGHSFIEQYVQLMCEYDTEHVADFVGLLDSGDLRLEVVLPAMEDGGAVDAAVLLMAREGQVKEAMERLTKHLETLESAVLGLISGQSEFSSVDEAVDGVLETIQKYTHVGIWLCQKYTSKGNEKQPRDQPKSRSKSDLSAEEQLWLDLIDTVVRLTKNVTAELRSQQFPIDSSISSAPSAEKTSQNDSQLSAERITASLRTNVQQTFTALLGATTTTPTPVSEPHTQPRKSAQSQPTPSKPSSLSFLRILRAFLTHASLSSPSLSDLRSVLSSIFSAYAYEESLLALSNRLLEKDLFVHVEEAAERRQRGWRPLGQVCEGCRRRVWGPGAGGGVWDAWRKRMALDEVGRRESERRGVGSAAPGSSSGPGDRDANPDGDERSRDRGKGRETATVDNDAETETLHKTPEDVAEDLGPLVIFSCRHIFHRVCLERSIRACEEEEEERRREQGDEVGRAGDEPSYKCVICP